MRPASPAAKHLALTIMVDYYWLTVCRTPYQKRKVFGIDPDPDPDPNPDQPINVGLECFSLHGAILILSVVMNIHLRIIPGVGIGVGIHCSVINYPFLSKRWLITINSPFNVQIFVFSWT